MPIDRAQATLIGRVWSPAVAGPVVVLARDDALFDLPPVAPTVQALLELDDPLRAIGAAGNLQRIGDPSCAFVIAGEPRLLGLDRPPEWRSTRIYTFIADTTPNICATTSPSRARTDPAPWC